MGNIKGNPNYIKTGAILTAFSGFIMGAARLSMGDPAGIAMIMQSFMSISNIDKPSELEIIREQLQTILNALDTIQQQILKLSDSMFTEFSITRDKLTQIQLFLAVWKNESFSQYKGICQRLINVKEDIQTLSKDVQSLTRKVDNVGLNLATQDFRKVLHSVENICKKGDFSGFPKMHWTKIMSNIFHNLSFWANTESKTDLVTRNDSPSHYEDPAFGPWQQGFQIQTIRDFALRSLGFENTDTLANPYLACKAVRNYLQTALFLEPHSLKITRGTLNYFKTPYLI
jgi:prefoldin subunit 5